jgi:two-component system osmolarity sensor histidine kinase EnvZ
VYLTHLRNRLQRDLPGSEVVLARTAMPTEIFIRPVQLPERWFVLKWQVARPETPLAMALIVFFGALVALLGAALFARRLTAPLADLAEATRRVAGGERVTVNTASGPTEVRSLAVAFQAMSSRLAELDEQRELMLAGLSHDLRSPLARVRVAVELLDHSDLSLVQQITVDVEEIDRMVAQFLHYVRAGYRESPVVACLDDVVRDSLSPYLRGVDLQLELNAAEPRLIAIDSVRRVVCNLVQNAFEYGQAPVTVRTTLQPRALRISVADRGAGISQRDWAQAVRPFHRLRAAPGTGHSGLGLATVERLVRASQGTLEATHINGSFTVDATLNAPPPTSDV